MGDSWTALLRLIISLPLVVLLIYISLKLGLGRRVMSLSGSLQVVDQIMVGAKSYLVVVRVQQHFLLLAVNEKSIQVLKEFADYPVEPRAVNVYPPYLAKFLNRMDPRRRMSGEGDQDER